MSDCEPSGTVAAERFSSPHIVGRQRDAGARSRVATTICGAIAVRVGAQCDDRGQNDERARGDPAGGERARPVRPQRASSRVSDDGLSESPMPPR